MTAIDWLPVVVSVVVAFLGAMGGIALARSKASETAKSLIDTALKCWQDLANERQEEISRLRGRVEELDALLTENTRRLTDYEKQLGVERQRNLELEKKVRVLEQEREVWRVEREQHQRRIAELERARA